MIILTPVNRISIAELVIYILYLGMAIMLAVRHGFRRNAGWVFIILFCILHIIGASLDLASTSALTNNDSSTALSLRAGAATVRNIGPAPLVMCMLSLLGKVLGTKPKKQKHWKKNKNGADAEVASPPAPSHPRAQGLIFKRNNPANLLRIVEGLLMISIILGIVAGIKTSEELHRGSLGVLLAGFAILAIAAMAAVKHVFSNKGGQGGGARGDFEHAAAAVPFIGQHHGNAMAVGQPPSYDQAQQYPLQNRPYDSRASYDGEENAKPMMVKKHAEYAADCSMITAGVAAALLFVLIRLIYAGLGTFADEESARHETFRQYGDNPRSVTYLAALAVAMDVIATGVLEVTGVMLRSRKSK